MKLEEAESKFVPTEDGKYATDENGIVATAFPEATYAGIEILKAGGNIILAAITMSQRIM